MKKKNKNKQVKQAKAMEKAQQLREDKAELERWTMVAGSALRAASINEVDDVLATILRALERERCPTIVGASGVGKTAVVGELFRRHASQPQPALAGVRPLRISIRRRVTALPKRDFIGQVFTHLVDIICRCDDDILLIIDDGHQIESFDLEAEFEHLLLRRPGRVIVEGLPGPMRDIFEYCASLFELCTLVPLSEPDGERCQRMLRGRDPELRRFDDAAITTAIELTDRFLGQRCLPGKAVALLGDAVDDRETDQPISAAAVRATFCRREQVPVSLVDTALAPGPVATSSFLGQRLLGQDQAVAAVVRTVAMVRAGLCDRCRPFGTFLFAGPTGVGKTYLAKLLAEHLFGDAERVLRLDMAEFNQQRSASVLMGDPDAYQLPQKRGVLALRLARLGFGVVLLDEFEKAHAAVHDALLPVLDEGAYVNGHGESVGCRSVVIIATTNVGAEAHRHGFGFATKDAGNEAERLIDSYFRPEFLNRFDEIISFQPLNRDRIRAIARREIKELAERPALKRQGIRLVVSDAVIDYVVERGFDPEYGARFLRRCLEREVITALAGVLLGPSRTNSELYVDVINQQVQVATVAPDRSGYHDRHIVVEVG